MKICVVIPAYNESKEIGKLIREIKSSGLPVLIIDDASKDDTAKISLGEGAVVIENAVNKGKGACLKAGFKYAVENGFDAVITMDGDGQHLTEDLPLFIEEAKNPGFDMLVGNRMLKTSKMPLERVITNKFMSWLISWLCGQRIPDTQCGFRMIKRNILEKVDLKTSKFETESEILIKASRLGFKIGQIQIKTIYSGEKSKINPFIDTIRFLKFIFLGK